MLYHSDAKVICTQQSILCGTTQRLNVVTSVFKNGKVFMPRCGFYNGSTECIVCIRKLRAYFDTVDLRDPSEIIRVSDLPDPHP